MIGVLVVGVTEWWVGVAGVFWPDVGVEGVFEGWFWECRPDAGVEGVFRGGAGDRKSVV